MEYFKFDYDDSIVGENVVLFLHGWERNKKDFNFFYNSISSRSIRCINISLYGFGKSRLPKIYFDTYEYAIQLFLFLKSKNINEVYLIGHSFGCRIILILASIFDIRIKGILLTGAAGLKPKFNLYILLKIWIYKIIRKIGININHSNINNDKIKYNLFVRVVNQHLDYLLPYINCKNTYLFWGMKDFETPGYMLKKFKSRLGIIEKNVILTKNNHFSFICDKYRFLSHINYLLSLR